MSSITTMAIPATMRMTFQCRLTKAAISFTASFVRFAALFAVCAVFFVRLIPVYYDEHSDVQSRRRYVKSFWIETLWIAIFTAALETVSFHFYAYLVSGAVGAFLWGIRLRKVFALHKKYKAEDDDGD